jgi:hypothetical protein
MGKFLISVCDCATSITRSQKDLKIITFDHHFSLGEDLIPNPLYIPGFFFQELLRPVVVGPQSQILIYRENSNVTGGLP